MQVPCASALGSESGQMSTHFYSAGDQNLSHPLVAASQLLQAPFAQTGVVMSCVLQATQWFSSVHVSGHVSTQVPLNQNYPASFSALHASQKTPSRTVGLSGGHCGTHIALAASQ